MLQAGAAQVCITPPVGVELAGYGPRLKRYSQDVHDELSAQALVLDDGESRYAVVTCDVIALSAAFVAEIRREAAKRTNILPQHIMISCSHSHTAPTMQAFRDWGTPDRSYARMVGRIIAGAIVAAERHLQSAEIRVGKVAHADLAWNRVGSDLVDDTVEVVHLASPSGASIALFVHYACHPVMLGPKPTISADYPGALRKYLQVRYPDAVVMFANGACGDIDPVTNRAVWGQGTFDDVWRAGRGLGISATQATLSATRIGDVKIQSRVCPLELAYALPTLEMISERIAQHTEEVRAQGNVAEDFKAPSGEVQMPRFWLRYYKALEQRLASGQQAPSVTVELQALLIGDTLALVGIPAEVFTEQGLAIRRASRFPHTLAVCYANGLYGYLPTRRDYERGGYASLLGAAVYDMPQFQPDVTERLVEGVAQLLA